MVLIFTHFLLCLGPVIERAAVYIYFSVLLSALKHVRGHCHLGADTCQLGNDDQLKAINMSLKY